MIMVERFVSGRWRQVAGAKVESLATRKYRVAIPYDVPMPTELRSYDGLKLRLGGKHEAVKVVAEAVDEVRVVLDVNI